MRGCGVREQRGGQRGHWGTIAQTTASKQGKKKNEIETLRRSRQSAELSNLV